MTCLKLREEVKEVLRAIRGNCLIYAYEPDLSVVMLQEPPKAMDNYLMIYAVCREGEGVIYVLTGDKAVKCVGGEVREVLKRYLYPDTCSLLIKSRDRVRRVEELVGS